MLLVAADTSGKDGSIALARGNLDGSCEVIEVVPLAGGTFSAQLVPQIAALLARHGFHKEDIGAFAVASGPGSFTGLRVGLAAVKALAEALKKPIAAVSRLEALAGKSKSQGNVMAVFDAGRGEVYAGRYEIRQRAKLISERLLTMEEFLGEAAGHTVITADHTPAGSARAAGLPVEQVDSPRSDAIARLGWLDILAGKTVTPEALAANYLRRSDAEIFSKSH